LVLSIEELHHDYLLMSKINTPIVRKCRLLTELLAETENPWRVIGITKSALKVFEGDEFNRKPRMRINRAHLVDRLGTYSHLFENVCSDPDEWWSYYYERDTTVLSTSSENMSNALSDVIWFSEFPSYNEEDCLFKSSGFSWSYRKKKEKPFLQELSSWHGKR